MPTLRRAAPYLLLCWLLLGALAQWETDSHYGVSSTTYTHIEGAAPSDLSQQWLGLRIWLGEGGNPYSAATQQRIQVFYYGHEIDLSAPHHPTDPQGFFYPLPIVWLLGLFTLLPFATASAVFKVLAVGLLIATTLSYLAQLGWPREPGARWALALATAGTLGGLNLWLSDQPTILAYSAVLGAVWCLARGRLGWAGGLLALAWVKPQLAVLPTLGLGLWLATIPTRRPTLIIGSLTLAALIGPTLLLLPGWPGDWLQNLAHHPGAHLDGGGLIGRVIVAGLVLAGWFAVRRAAFSDERVQYMIAATLVGTALLQSPWNPYGLTLFYVPLLALMAHQRAPSPAPPLLSGLALIAFLAPLPAYGLLLLAYARGGPMLTLLDWPGWPAQVTLTLGLLIQGTTLILVLAYLAWGATLVGWGGSPRRPAAQTVLNHPAAEP